MAIVYIHKSKDTRQVFYVGIGKSEKRANSKHDRSSFWKRTVAKHGYTIHITHKDILWEDACLIERYLISFWRENSKMKLCNMTDGGEGVLGLKVSEERKLLYKEMFKGENNPFYGKKHSCEVRKKMSENNNPRKFITEEHKIKISKSNKGLKRSEETKKKLSDIKKGRPAHNKGKKLSEETKNKISEKIKSLNTEEYKAISSKRMKEFFKNNPEARKKISLSQKGRASHRKGVKLSEETKMKLSEINKGKIISEEQKLKVSKFHKGRKRSEETKKRISESIKQFHKKRKDEVHNGW